MSDKMWYDMVLSLELVRWYDECRVVITDTGILCVRRGPEMIIILHTVYTAAAAAAAAARLACKS